ncbi:MAG: hypothetical protein LBB65_00180 [Burkholderiales bacterium]|jgi:hypothetical protein|nr:hypothetical protein [Burkholderiales bacterium]
MSNDDMGLPDINNDTTKSAKGCRRLLVRVGIGIAVFFAVVFVFFAWMGVMYSRADHRAQAFCGAFTVGETISPEKLDALLEGIPNRLLLHFNENSEIVGRSKIGRLGAGDGVLLEEFSEGNLRISADFHLPWPERFVCNVALDDWGVVSKDIKFLD